MADSNTPYKREGDDNAWNKLIRDVNEKAEECDLEPLEEVEDCHRLAKSDIREMQDLLKEICEDNEFTEVKDRWSREIIQELEDAAEADPCCCEETDKIFPNLNRFVFQGGYKIFFSSGGTPAPQTGWQTFDWAGWIMQEVDPLIVTPVECDDPDPDTEIREGGRGWVGKEFKHWELFLYNLADPNPPTPWLSGEVRDGYIQIENEGTPKFLNKCGEPENSGTPLGENDTAWNFPYEVEYTNGNPPWRIFSLNTSFSSTVGSSFFQHSGQVGVPFPSAPITIPTYQGSDTPRGFLRLKCSAPEA